MCRLIAKASIQATTILDEMLHCPVSLKYLSTQGRLPDNPQQRGEHNDGCGIAFVADKGLEVHKRGQQNAWDESYLKLVQEASSKLFIAHNRLASAGLEPHIDGTHPFELEAQGVPYCFSHNGTIYDFVPEAKSKNTSDSNLFLQQIISQKESNDESQIIRRLSQIMNNTNHSSLIGTLLSPEKLMVWRIFNDQNKAVQSDYEMYYTLYMKFNKEAVVFASEPLDDEGWTLLPNRAVISVQPDEHTLKMSHTLLS